MPHGRTLLTALDQRLPHGLPIVLAAPAVFLLIVKTSFDRSWTTRPVIYWSGGFAACFDVLGECDPTKLAYFAGLGILLVLLCLANRQQQVAPDMGREMKTAISSSTGA